MIALGTAVSLPEGRSWAKPFRVYVVFFYLLIGRRASYNRAIRVELGNQPLGDDAKERVGHHIGLHAEVNESVRGARGRIGMERSIDNVACFGRPDKLQSGFGGP